MVLIKITILLLFVLFIWTMYVSSKLRTDMDFNANVTINKKYPRWYLGYIWFVFIVILLTFISLVYLLFIVWK